MKKVLLFSAITAVIFASCGGGKISKVTSLGNLTDSLSYAIGSNIGESFKASFESEDINMAVVAAAIQAAMDGETITSAEDNNAIIQEYFTIIKPAKDKAKDSIYIAETKGENSNIQETESGLLYEIIEEGDKTIMPTEVDTVMMLYTGTFTNGDVFDSTSNRNNEPTPLVVGQVIPGFKEGVKLIGKGGKINLWIPSEIGYGDGKLRIFEVEIVDIKKPATEE